MSRHDAGPEATDPPGGGEVSIDRKHLHHRKRHSKGNVLYPGDRARLRFHEHIVTRRRARDHESRRLTATEIPAIP